MTQLSRRVFVGGSLVLIGSGLVSFRRPTAVESSSVNQGAVAAQKFVDFVGINVHATWRNTLWGSSDWEAAFIDSGVKNVRSHVGQGGVGHAALTDLRRLFAKQVKLCALVTRRTLDTVETEANIDFLANKVGAENIAAIEGPNEFNKPSSAPADWAGQLRSFMTWMHDTIRSYPALADVPIVAPSIWGRLTNDYLSLGNLEPHVDRANLHYYTGGRRPTKGGKPKGSSEAGGSGDYALADAIREARLLAPTKPLWITEYGYPIAAAGIPLSRWVISETAAAKYLIRGLFDAFGHGVEKVYIYSLIDDVHRAPPRYHGLLDGRLRERQTYHSVRNLMALFADTGREPRPRQLAHRLSNVASSIKRHLFQKSDGTILLTMYQDVDSYDRARSRDVAVQPVSIGLHLAQPAASIEVFNPTVSAAAIQRIAKVSALSVPVGDHVTVVKITP